MLRRCLACALLLVGATASAQVGIQTVCAGNGAPVVDFGMLIDNGVDTPTSIGSLAAGGVINEAECECNSKDLFLQGVISRPLPLGSLPPFSVWEGSGCNAVTARSTTGTICEQIQATVNPMSFWAGGGSARPQQIVDVRALIAPNGASSPANPLPHSCPAGGINISNAVWMLFGDPNNPDYCSVVVPADTIPPNAPINFTAGVGDGSVALHWTSPPVGTALPPATYQVLCADADGNPLPGQGAYDMTDSIHQVNTNRHILQYSVCTAGGLQRRVLTTGSPTITPTLPDLGVAAVPGATFVVEPQSVDAGVPRGPLGATAVVTASPLLTLDKKFVCSDPIDNVGLNHSQHIDGLTNDVGYQFAVVSIDGSGNTAVTEVLVATPRPTQDLYQRFIAEGGAPQGFCFVATAAFGSYQSPYVMVLRRFRDEALLPRGWGRAFVDWYYRTSPPFAEYIVAHPAVRWMVRQALWPIILGAAAWLYLAWWEQALVAALALGLWARWRAGRAARRRTAAAVGA